MAKPLCKDKDGMKYVIILAFGKAAESPHRQLDEFKRKSLAEIATGNDKRLEYARIAPSSSNTQPWYFICEDGNVNVYRKKLNGIKLATYGKMNQIDMGIALCHISVAGEKLGMSFHFSDEKNGEIKNPDGYEYVGSVLQ